MNGHRTLRMSRPPGNRLKVLHISNHSQLRCGIQNFGYQLTTALRLAGCEVTDWDAYYPVLHAREEAGEAGYLPVDWTTYDVIHLNWHPAASNIYQPGHFPGGPPIFSVFLHDIPPWSTCPVVEAVDVVVLAELFPEMPAQKVLVVCPYPVVDWVTDLPPQNEVFTVGVTGVRGDGFEAVTKACRDHDWILNAKPPDQWLTLEDEIRRLARSTVNVCWYAGDRGLSGAASTCLASRRPLLINTSPMLRHLPSGGGILKAAEGFDVGYVLSQLNHSWLRREESIAHLTWANAAEVLIEAWTLARDATRTYHAPIVLGQSEAQ